MAFNPLHAFRKHQKVFLAGLTILTMFIFIFSFSATSGGDFFSEITRIIAGRQHSDMAANIYGKEVRAHDIEELQKQRRLANIYLFQAIGFTHQAVIKKIEADLLPQLKDDPRTTSEITEVVRSWQEVFAAPSQNPYSVVQYYFSLRRYVGGLFGTKAQLQAKERTTEANLVQQLIDVLEQDMIVVPMIYRIGEAPPTGRYFAGSYQDVKDLIDFKIWLHKADELGIQLTQRDVAYLLAKEVRGPLGPDDKRKIFSFLRNNFKYATYEMVDQAITNEFRVRLAQAAVMGFEGRPDGGVAPAVTPYDFYDFYRNQRTESIVAVLPIPVNHKDFLAKVADPQDAELLALFDKYKNREHSPDSDKPGFKQPPRVQVEWISARADLPFYQEQARKQSEVLPAVRQVALQLAAGSVDVGLTSTAVSATLPLAVDLPLLARYEQTRSRAPEWMRVPSRLDTENLRPLAANLERAENVAAMWGQALGAAATQGTVLTAPLAQHAPGIARDIKERTLLWSNLFLAGTSPSPFTSAALAYKEIPSSDVLPLAAVRDYVKEQEREELARQLVRRNMMQVREELDALRDRPETLRQKLNATRPTAIAALLGQVLGDAGTAVPNLSAAVSYAELVAADEYKIQGRDGAEMFLAATQSPLTAATLYARQQGVPQEMARTYIDRAIKEYSLTHGATAKPRDRFDIAQDEGLKTLKEVYLHFGKEKEFARNFFGGEGTYVAQRMPRNPHARGMEEQEINEWAFGREPILYWKTAETPAQVPTFGEAYERVKERWKFEKARALARAEAERLAVEARKVKGDADRFLKDGSAHSGEMFMLTNVSRLEKPRFPMMTRQSMSEGPYKRYKLPEDKIEYPTGDFLERLLALKEPGEVAVLHDRPEANYYVVAFVAKMPGNFFEEYAQHPRELLGYLENENHLRQRYREEIVRQLQQEAKLQVNEEFAKDFEKRRDDDER